MPFAHNVNLSDCRRRGSVQAQVGEVCERDGAHARGAPPHARPRPPAPRTRSRQRLRGLRYSHACVIYVVWGTAIRMVSTGPQVQPDIRGLRHWYTDKKEYETFLIYKKIQNEAVAKSYMTNGLLIYGEYLRISSYIS